MNDEQAFWRAIDATPGDRLPQLVFADWLDDRGRSVDAMRLRRHPPVVRCDEGSGSGDGSGDGSHGDGSGGYGGFGLGGDGGGSYSDGDGGSGSGDGGSYGDGDGGSYGDGGYGDGGYGDDKLVLSRGLFMSDGLQIVHMPAGWNPYVVIAWCKIADGWVHFAPGYRVLRRFGGSAQSAVMAAKGPQADTQLLDPAPLAGGCSTACVSRFDVCDPKAWAKEMPEPKGGT